MPEQKFAASESSAQGHSEGSDITHTVSHEAGNKLSLEASDLMRAQKTGDSKPKPQDDETMKHFMWEMLVWGLP